MSIGSSLERFDPESFLSLARRLNRPDAVEADLRTICGRAYYAVFLIADAQLKMTSPRRRLRPLHSGPHERVIRQASQRNPSVGSMMERLRRLRNDADYVDVPSGPDLSFWRLQALLAIQLAERLLPRVRRL